MTKFTLERKCCKPQFEREQLEQVNDVPKDELFGFVNKLEIMGGFKKQKKVRRVLCGIYLIALIVVLVGGAVRHHHQRDFFRSFRAEIHGMPGDPHGAGPHAGRRHHNGKHHGPHHGKHHGRPEGKPEVKPEDKPERQHPKHHGRQLEENTVSEKINDLTLSTENTPEAKPEHPPKEGRPHHKGGRRHHEGRSKSRGGRRHHNGRKHHKGRRGHRGGRRHHRGDRRHHHLRRRERKALKMIRERNQRPIPAEIFPLVDEEHPTKPFDFKGYFREEIMSAVRRSRRHGCHRGRRHHGKWRKFFRRMRNKHMRRGRGGCHKNKRNRQPVNDALKPEEQPKDRVLEENKPATAVAVDSHMEPAFEMKEQKPEEEFKFTKEIQEFMKNATPEQREIIHKAVTFQRDEDLKKFNVFVQKERLVTLMTTFLSLRHGHHGGLFFILFPIFAIILFKMKRRCAYKRLKKIIQIENEVYWHKRGYHWSINKRLTELTLSKNGGEVEVQMTNISYPDSVVGDKNPFSTSPEQSPLQTEAAPAQGQPMIQFQVPFYAQAPEYARVNNTDVSVDYKTYQ